jgi:hypothetical protein
LSLCSPGHFLLQTSATKIGKQMHQDGKHGIETERFTHLRPAKMLETSGKIDPSFFEKRIPVGLAGILVKIQRNATRLGKGLRPDSATDLADLARVMDC